MKKLTILTSILASSVLSFAIEITSDNVNDYNFSSTSQDFTFVPTGSSTQIDASTVWKSKKQLIVESGTTVNFTHWQTSSIYAEGNVTIKENATVYFNGGLINTGNISVNGLLKTNSHGGAWNQIGNDSYPAFTNVGTLTFGANSSFLSEYLPDGNKFKMVNLIGGTVNVAISKENNYIKFADYVVFNNTKLTLNSSNVIISGYGRNSAQTQADSIFILANCANNVWSKSDVTITANKANEFGTFKFYDGSSLTLDLVGLSNEDSFIINTLESIALVEGKHPQSNINTINPDAVITLNLKLNEDSKLQIGNLYNDFTKEENGERILSNLAVNLYNEDTKAYDIAGILGENFFISADGWISSVPEPAEWAMIFGALALGFVAYRRRK
ncbi:MAG: PEP-CTERM sorting domain-containing protein [Verrucomicrobiaceae bacterium]|nr:PEP-CTERM sorting domain-containing protein [Verrucomicrobiaceae bacterium]